MNKRTFLLLLLLIGPVTCFAAYVIKGNLGKIGNGYYPKVYLSYMGSVNGLYSISTQNIINSAPIAADGSFVLTGNEISGHTAFYHVYLTQSESTNADLQATETPNFIVLALNSSSRVELKANTFRSFNDVRVTADGLNIQVQRFFKFVADQRTQISAKSSISDAATAAASQHFRDEMLKYADTSNNAIIFAGLNPCGRFSIALYHQQERNETVNLEAR